VLLPVAAAVLLVVSAVSLWTRADRGTELPFESVAMGDVTVAEQEWGTSISLDLIGLPERDVYQLWFIDQDGQLTPVVSWPSSPQGFAKVSGGVPNPPDDLARLIITSSDAADVVLTASPAA
jgi:hypothetical protein